MCAWCGKELGAGLRGDAPRTEHAAATPRQVNPPREDTKRVGDQETSSTICPDCAEWLMTYRKPVLVVSREWARMYDQLVEMLKGQPEIEVILDRRGIGSGNDGVDWSEQERRRPERLVLR
jgi:hypothetical protein